MPRSLALMIVATLLAHARSARAQDDSGIGYGALVFTPSACVAPVAREWMPSDPGTKGARREVFADIRAIAKHISRS